MSTLQLVRRYDPSPGISARRLECTLTIQRNVRMRKFTVNVCKNRAQHRKMQLVATNPYCSMIWFNVPKRRLVDNSRTHRLPLWEAASPEEGRTMVLPTSCN